MLDKRHPFDKRGALEKGNKAEMRARLAIEFNNKQVKTATSQDDKTNHIDLFIVSGTTEVPVQVKSRPSSYPDYLCVELKGTVGIGSLWATKSYYLFFETATHFLVIKMSELREWVKQHIKDEISSNKHYAITNRTKYLRRSKHGDNHLAFVPVTEIEKFPGTQKLAFAPEKELGLLDMTS